MKPSRFSYRRARTVGEALAWLADEDSERLIKVLAGGQSLVPLMNLRLARPSVLVDINPIRELGTVAVEDGWLRLGATVRHSDLIASARASEWAPLLTAAASHVGHRAIRNLGTLGGSLAHADPAAELPAAVVALGAEIGICGPSPAPRAIAAEDLFVGPFLTSLLPTELLREVRVPDQRGSTWGFAEVARRPGDFAIAGVAAVVHQDDGICQSARLVGFGVGDGPVRLASAERLLGGTLIDADSAHRAGEAAAEGIPSPPTDIHASSAYRQHLISVLTEQVLLELHKRDAPDSERDRAQRRGQHAD